MQNDSIAVADFVTITSIRIAFVTLVEISLCVDFVAFLYGSRRELMWFLSMLSTEKCENSVLTS